MSSKSKKEVSAIVEALDEAPLDDEQVKATVDDLGIDVKQMAARIRVKVATAAYAEELARLEQRKHEARRTREENLTMFRALLAKAPPQAVAMHFHKYESASDEELEELVQSLRHLLGEDDSD